MLGQGLPALSHSPVFLSMKGSGLSSISFMDRLLRCRPSTPSMCAFWVRLGFSTRFVRAPSLEKWARLPPYRLVGGSVGQSAI